MIVTRQELEEFILSQDSARPLRFEESYWHRNGQNQCGCLFIHYALNKWPDATFVDAHLRRFRMVVDSIEQLIHTEVVFDFWGKPKTYGDLQRNVLELREANGNQHN